MKNTLAYYETATITAVKGFVVQAPVVKPCTQAVCLTFSTEKEPLSLN